MPDGIIFDGTYRIKCGKKKANYKKQFLGIDKINLLSLWFKMIKLFHNIRKGVLRRSTPFLFSVTSAQKTKIRPSKSLNPRSLKASQSRCIMENNKVNGKCFPFCKILQLSETKKRFCCRSPRFSRKPLFN